MSPRRRPLQDASIDATVLRGLLLDAFKTAKTEYRKNPPPIVWVSAALVMHRLKGHPSSTVRYHRDTCAHFQRSVDHPIEIGRAVAVQRGFCPCHYCDQLNLRTWCRSVGLEQSQVWQVITKHHTRVRKTVAVRLMQAIGEQPHPSLLAHAK